MMRFIKQYFSSGKKSTKVTIAVLALLVISLPVALFAASTQQQSKEEAAGLKQACGLTNTPMCPVDYTCKLNKIPDTGGFCVPQPSTFPTPVCAPKATNYMLTLDVSDSMRQVSGSQSKITAAISAMDDFIDDISKNGS